MGQAMPQLWIGTFERVRVGFCQGLVDPNTDCGCLSGGLLMTWIVAQKSRTCRYRVLTFPLQVLALALLLVSTALLLPHLQPAITCKLLQAESPASLGDTKYAASNGLVLLMAETLRNDHGV